MKTVWRLRPNRTSFAPVDWRPASGGLLLAAALAATLAHVPIAAGEEQPSPFRFLRPSVEEGPAAPPALGEVPADSPQPVDVAPTVQVEAEVPPAADGAADPAASEPPTAAEPAASDRAALPSQAALPGPSTGDAPPRLPQPLRLAVIAGGDARRTLAAIEPMAEGLGRVLGRPVDLLPMASYGAMIDAQVEQRIDGGFYSAASFALAQATCRCLEPIAAPAASDGTVAYRAVIVARRGSGIGSAADLAGRTVAVGAPDSIGARRMQLAALAADGFDPKRFGAVREVASADAAVRLLAQGGADAAFAWSALTGGAAEGYSRGTLASLAAHGEIAPEEFEIVWQSPPITHGPVAVASSLSEADKSAIRTHLLGLAKSEPDAYDALDPFYGGGYVAVAPQDYAGVELLAAGGAEGSSAAAEPNP